MSFEGNDGDEDRNNLDDSISVRISVNDGENFNQNLMECYCREQQSDTEVEDTFPRNPSRTPPIPDTSRETPGKLASDWLRCPRNP